MKRKVVFVFYDKHGIIDDYVLYLLQTLHTEIGSVLFVVNGLITEESRRYVVPLVEQIIVRPNEGFDAWAYKEGIAAIDKKELKTLDALVLMNDTCFGPIFPWNDVFSRMESQKGLDFWGLTSSAIGVKDLYREKRLCGRHIDTYFTVFHRKLLRSRFFREYWENLPVIHNYDEAVGLNERRMTEFFAQNGFTWASAYEVKPGRDHVFFAPYHLIADQHCPLLKRRAFTNPNYAEFFCDGRISDMPKVLRYLEHETHYPVEYLWQHILRFSGYQRVLRNLSLSKENHILAMSSAEMDIDLLIPYRWPLTLAERCHVGIFYVKKFLRKSLRLILYPFLRKYFGKMKP